jgi:hypothetical protein
MRLVNQKKGCEQSGFAFFFFSKIGCPLEFASVPSQKKRALSALA